MDGANAVRQIFDVHCPIDGPIWVLRTVVIE